MLAETQGEKFCRKEPALNTPSHLLSGTWAERRWEHHVPSLSHTHTPRAQSASHPYVTCPVCLTPIRHMPCLFHTHTSRALTVSHPHVTCPDCLTPIRHVPCLFHTHTSRAQTVSHPYVTCHVCLTPIRHTNPTNQSEKERPPRHKRF